MTAPSRPLTADSSVGAWLDHPVGGPIIRELLAQAGQDPGVLRPVRRMAIKRLVRLSRGSFTSEMLDDLVRRAQAGDVPAAGAGMPAGESAGGAAEEETVGGGDGTVRPEWVERVTPERFAGQTVIVTGAGSGIGRATASRVAREGGRVIAVDLVGDRLDALAAALSDRDIRTVAIDLTATGATEEVVAAAGGQVDGLANVAGIMDDMTPVHEVSDDTWRRVFAVNLDATMRLMRAVLPGMLARGAGAIVNVASEASLRGSAAGAAYTASKHAVVGLTRSSAFMYGPSGLRINAVAPGPVLTGIEARFASPLGAERVRTAMAVMPDVVEPEALAAAITFLLSDDGVNINGAIVPSDGGWSAA